jgi:chromosome segregation ATPase
MDSRDDITVQILRDIRQEIRDTRDGLREELKQTRDELRVEIRQTREELNGRVDGITKRMDSVETRAVEAELRTANALVALNATMREVHLAVRENTLATQTIGELIRDDLGLHERVARCEREIAELKRRGRNKPS